mgnify:CR=1 FL=1
MWKEFLEWAEVYREPFIQAVTFVKYESTAKIIRDHFGEKTINEIQRRDLQMFFNALSKKYQKLTIKTIYQQILAFYQSLVDEGDLDRNLMNGIRFSGVEKDKKRKFMEVEEVELLIKALDLTDRRDVMIYTSLQTGLRFAEVLGITPGDLYEQGGLYMVKIDKTLDYKYTHEFKTTKTKSSIRDISITTDMFNLLNGWAGAHCVPEGQSILGSCPSATVNRRLEILCEEIDIPPISFHGLRHTHGSLLIRQGVPVISVSKRLGHADTVVTQKIYIHLLEEQEKEDNLEIVKLLEAI